MKFLKLEDGYIGFKCPGCKGPKTLPVEGPQAWGFNGDYENPTLTPSILATKNMPSGKFICHSYVRNGSIEFLNDCTHALAGKTVELEHVTEFKDLFFGINDGEE